MDAVQDIATKVAELAAVGLDAGPPVGGPQPLGPGVVQQFASVLVAVHPTYGVHEVHGLILDRYLHLGGPGSFLGYPTSDEQGAGPGRFSTFEFQGSVIAWHPTYGVHEVHGLIGQQYLLDGGPGGSWGYPVSDEYPDGAGRASDTEGGTIAWSPVDGLAVGRADGQSFPPSARDWPGVPLRERMRYCMGQLVLRYGYPPNGAAGIVGNLCSESGLIPNRVEGSASSSPQRAKTLGGATADMTADEIMSRRPPTGPALPGIGLAQWTTPSRRQGLFSFRHNDVVWAADALLSMDCQLAYLAVELSTLFSRVRSVVTAPGTSVDAASDEVVYNFEIPAAVLADQRDERTGKVVKVKRPRSDAQVQDVFRARRALSAQALASL